MLSCHRGLAVTCPPARVCFSHEDVRRLAGLLGMKTVVPGPVLRVQRPLEDNYMGRVDSSGWPREGGG